MITSTGSGLLLTIMKGATFEVKLSWADASGPVNVTTWDFELQIRARASATSVLLSFTRPTQIVAGPTTADIILRLPRAVTLVQAWETGEWDLRVTIPGSPAQTSYPFGVAQPAVFLDTVAE